MTARIRVTRALKLGVYAGRPLDGIFTGECTIATVGLVFGGWAGSTIGGSGWAVTVRSLRRRSGSKMAASLAIPLAVGAGTVTVAKITGSVTILSRFLAGAAIMAYLLARETSYRFIFAALLVGAFVGAIMMIASFVLGVLGVSIDRRDGSAKSKRMRSELANTA